MSGDLFAAIDLGASSGRVVLGKVGHGELHATTITRFPNPPVISGTGLHWNLLELYSAALDGLRKASESFGEIRSVGVDSWGVDYALLEGGPGALRMLGEPFHYRDDRSARGVANVHARMSHPELFRRNGLEFLPFTTVYQLAAEPSEILVRADRLLFIPDVVSYWLTGVPFAERTIASTSGLLNATDGRWDEAVFARLGLPRGLMPDLVEPGEPVGALRPEVARLIDVGTLTGVTAVGSHDTASAVVAVPMQADAAAYISCGTWGLVGVEVEHPVLTQEALEARFTNEGGVDRRIRLLRNVMGLWVLSEAMRTWEREGDQIDLPALLGAAGEVRTPVSVFDVEDPRFLAPGDMPTRITDWCEEHGVAPPRSRAECVRSIIESLAQAFADASHRAGQLGGVRLRVIHIVGGGSLNELLCQRIADRARLPVLAGPVEATALGNILIQARSADSISGSLEAIRDLVARTHPPRRYEPATLR